MTFKDYFSEQAGIYASSRPTYPEEMFRFITALCEKRDLAWDCATGNGQAAISLSAYFKKVMASDAGPEQIQNAYSKENIQYYVANATESGLEDKSVDLITVATAAHWLDLPRFYQEVERVLKPGGVLAMWVYTRNNISPEIDKIMENIALDVLKDFWPDEWWAADRGYRDLPFPYLVLPTPRFFARHKWTLSQLENYIFSWSASRKIIMSDKKHILYDALEELTKAWGNPQQAREVVWPLHLKTGINQ